MLELEVIPERSLGCDQWEFILGMHFSQAVAIIQSQLGIIKGVQVLYNELSPLSADLVINLSQDGVRLVFDPVSQRLKMIEVYNMRLIRLKYSGVVFNSPEVVPSIEQIEHSFGATHPGVYDKEKQIFQLNFRGLSFSFPVESKLQVVWVDGAGARCFYTVRYLQPGYAHGLGSLQFPNGSTPLVSRTSVYSGLNLTEARAPPIPICCYNGLLYLEHCEVIRDKSQTKGLRLRLYTEGTSRYPEPKKQTLTRTVLLGDTCQDVVTSLGAPSRLFYKSEDKMKIHSPNAHRRNTRKSDFFYNYFTLGIDVLFDASTQRIKKFILHTNYPGHYNFNIYHRCEFELQLGPADAPRPEESHASEDVVVQPVTSSRQRKKQQQQQQQQQPTKMAQTCGELTISAYTKWKELSHLVRKTDRPVVLNRASSTNTTNPFGSTFCYPFQDMIFEIMPNEHIASVTIHAAQAQLREV